MSVKISIICDTPEKERPGPAQHSHIRCLSSFNDNVNGYFSGDFTDIADAYQSLVKLAVTQGWRTRGRKILCPGCVRRLGINR